MANIQDNKCNPDFFQLLQKKSTRLMLTKQALREIQQGKSYLFLKYLIFTILIQCFLNVQHNLSLISHSRLHCTFVFCLNALKIRFDKRLPLSFMP